MGTVRGFADGAALDKGQLLRAPVRWPRPSRLDEIVAGPGPKAQTALENLGADTVGGLLEHLPRTASVARTIEELAIGESATVVVVVDAIKSRAVRRRGMRPMVEATVSDGTGTLKVAFFNQPWLVDRYRPGTRLLVQGVVQPGGKLRLSGHAPTQLQPGSAEGAATYPASEGITSTQIAALVQQHLPRARDLPELLPASIRATERLAGIADATVAMHAGAMEDGRRRIAFEELLTEQLVQRRMRDLPREGLVATALDEEPTLTRRWLHELLPFTPTDDQARAIVELDGELARNVPMQRLLLGDVGAGKTVVAVHAMLRAAEHGRQAALMAPTETLARQHFRTLQHLVPGELLPMALLTGSTKAAERKRILYDLAAGQLGIVIGTHALIEDPVAFHALSVVVIDEQHRFGVRQRARLEAKAPEGRTPHVLHLTATPIPRTQRLLEFGAVDVTELRALPNGRQPIGTHVAETADDRETAYALLRSEVAQGRQAFVVCPLVADSEELEARSAIAEFERLGAGPLKGLRLELLHGQMPAPEKEAAMARFVSGAAQVLVATTVIEVGIDVPNATVMLIEDAERFGVAQLHQLRGRVGRGQWGGQCVLFGKPSSPRLKALVEHRDGFKLAEIDLHLRGEGELTGVRQSGMARYRAARLPEDEDLLERAHAVADEVLAADPSLAAPEHVLLGRAVEAIRTARIAA
ncbi:MAG: ATP-dependent DNA helicase RecG [Solirubrobacteraceae bacterium]|nr:ATP-dependent DNA helicase RecG [Solirubrobacteraceae bacterium]